MKDRPIVDAFTDAWTNWTVDQHVGGVASGTTPTDCPNRLENMRFDALSQYPRLYDSSVAYLCQLHVFHDGLF